MCHFFDTMLLVASLLGVAGSLWILLVVYSSHYRVHLFHDSILPTQRPVAERVVCIGIKKDTSHPNGKTTLYFCRVGMSRYSFILFDNPINQEEKDEFMKSYEYIPYSDRVIFQYGGGAFGKQYFTKEEREEFLSKHQPW